MGRCALWLRGRRSRQLQGQDDGLAWAFPWRCQPNAELAHRLLL